MRGDIMNIFATSACPLTSAAHLDMKRVVKMILESFQLMSNAMWIHREKGFYKPTHMKHPCSTWTAASRENFEWLLNHALGLLAAYSDRYNKVHKCEEHLKTCLVYKESGAFPLEKRTPHVNCTTFKHIDDVHLAYRLQMIEKWKADKRAPSMPGTLTLNEVLRDWEMYESSAV
jgi:hypothetical protein